MTTCKSCRNKGLEVILDFGEQPLANGLLKKSECGKEKKYPLALCYCKSCGLAQLNYTVDPRELFSNYYWVTGTSKGARQFAEIFMNEVLKRKKIKSGEYVLEIASNDGTFLRAFRDADIDILGIDPAKNIASIANDSGIETIVDFFGSKAAGEIVEKKGYPAVFFARNVMAHVADIDDFIEGLKICSDDNNIGIVEVEYGGKIVNEIHYDSIYHEHLYYYTLHSLKEILEAHGLYIFDAMDSPISGGAIVVYFSKKHREVTKSVKDILNKEEIDGLDTIDAWKGFAQRAKQHKEIMKKMLGTVKGRIIGYGASARSSTMLNYCGINHNDIECIVDLNTLKQGLYTAGTHIPIVSADEGLKYMKPDCVLILAWNFEDEIKEFLRDQYGYDGDVIIPLPYPGRKENINAEKSK